MVQLLLIILKNALIPLNLIVILFYSYFAAIEVCFIAMIKKSFYNINNDFAINYIY